MPNSIYDELFLHILEKYHNHSKWDNAEFKKIKTLSNTGVGSVGQDFIHELCNKLNINSKLSKKSTEARDKNAYDIEIENIDFEIKTATEDTNFNFQFNHIRYHRKYEAIICLGVSPNDLYFNIWSKSDILTGKAGNLVSMEKGANASYKLTKSNTTRNVDFLIKNYFNGSLIKKFPVLNQRKDLLDREYSYYDYKYQDDVKLTPIPGSRLSYEFYNPHGRSDEKLYIIHSSFGERVLQFVQANYKHIVNRRYNPVSGRDFSSVPIVEDMEKYKPDTVVIVVNACLFKDILGLKLK